MYSSEKTRLCPFCEGDIPTAMKDCPYCGADLNNPKKQEELSFRAPPSVRADVKIKESKIESDVNDPFKTQRELFEQNQVKKPAKEGYSKLELLMIVLLTLGGELFALGLCILMFSTEGSLILKWSLKNSWILFALGLPSLIGGYFLFRRQKIV